jgi:hypothetical protein
MTPEKREKSDTVRFEKGTTIWPKRGRGVGVVKIDFTARRLEKKVRGLTGFEAIGNTELFYNGKTWPFLSGAKFGAYAK